MESKSRIKCPGCGKALAVNAELAGKTVSCPSCKAKFVIPLILHQGNQKQDNLSSGKEDRARALSDGVQTCPNCNAQMTEGAVLCTECGFHLERGEVIRSDICADKSGPAPQKEAGEDQFDPTKVERMTKRNYKACGSTTAWYGHTL